MTRADKAQSSQHKEQEEELEIVPEKEAKATAVDMEREAYDQERLDALSEARHLREEVQALETQLKEMHGRLLAAEHAELCRAHDTQQQNEALGRQQRVLERQREEMDRDNKMRLAELQQAQAKMEEARKELEQERVAAALEREQLHEQFVLRVSQAQRELEVCGVCVCVCVCVCVYVCVCVCCDCMVDC